MKAASRSGRPPSRAMSLGLHPAVTAWANDKSSMSCSYEAQLEHPAGDLLMMAWQIELLPTSHALEQARSSEIGTIGLLGMGEARRSACATSRCWWIRTTMRSSRTLTWSSATCGRPISTGMATAPPERAAVFLDHDGVIAPDTTEERSRTLPPRPGTPSRCSTKAHSSSWSSRTAGRSSGRLSELDVSAQHDRLAQTLAEQGGHIDGFFFARTTRRPLCLSTAEIASVASPVHDCCYELATHSA